jgi:exopolysaccharide biosynthesis polyprenyl glycosylphosphotransferase
VATVSGTGDVALTKAVAEGLATLRRDATSTRPRGAGGRPGWVRTYIAMLLVVDAMAALVGGEIARFAGLGGSIGPAVEILGHAVPYWLLAVGFIPVWLLAMAVGGSYDSRELGNGSEEYRRVIDSAIRVLAVVAVASYAARIELARGFVATVLPATLLLTVFGRHRVRKWVHVQRGRGDFMNQVVVVGSLEHATDLIRHLRGAPYAGYSVMGACVPGSAHTLLVDETAYPVLGEPADAERVVQEVQADCVAISDTASLHSGALRRMAWSLEGTGVDLIVVPALTDVSGPRIVTRPVAGLPLLHVEEPVLSGAARVFKEGFDRLASVIVLVVLLPFLALVAAIVRATSHGPALYRQTRVGRDGRHFVISKFRTMRNQADEERADVAHLNEHDGPLFKIRNDPRMTTVGRWLRRFSIDELPQLLHVVTGHMSLVGPRPPLPCEVEQYDEHTSRRLLVKPGVTGLWQVSGRADLSWDESVRLDLYYVENWSPALDFVILWKTMRAVLNGRGAY